MKPNKKLTLNDCTKADLINILEFCKDGFKEGHIYSDDVTHWMPLPSTEGIE